MLFAHLPHADYPHADLAHAFLHLAEVGFLPPNAPLTPGHKDGWGTVYYKNGNMEGWYRSTSAATNDEYREREINLITASAPDALLMHVRKGTVGEPSEHNSHPFVSGRFAFIHNGTLGKTDQVIFDPVRDRPLGETDSELYFHLVIQELAVDEEHEAAKVMREITRTVKALRVGTSHQGGGFTSASSILTDGRYAYVLREYDEKHPFVQKYNAHDYYTLFLGEGSGGEHIVCSEQLALPEVKWSLLTNHSITVIDLISGKVHTEVL